jgi:hypothetical protein
LEQLPWILGENRVFPVFPEPIFMLQKKSIYGLKLLTQIAIRSIIQDIKLYALFLRFSAEETEFTMKKCF